MTSLAIVFLVLLIVAVAGCFILLNSLKTRTSALDAAQAEKMNLTNELQLAQERKNSLQEEYAVLKGELTAERERSFHLNSQLTKSQTEFANLQQKLDEQKAEVEQLHEKFNISFKNLANEILEEKSKKFTDQNKENLGELLNPLREKIFEFQKKVEDTNLQGEKRSAALGEQLKNLRELNQQITQEAKSLTLALRGDSKAQGGWGEMQLEIILEKAGLQKDIHYYREKNFKNEEGGNQRLDFIVKLPDDKNFIIDSKVSLTAYSRYFECETEDEKTKCLQEHVNSIHSHIKLLSARNYQNLYNIKTVDYVFMFVANEPALIIAYQEDPQLFEKAWDKNIILVSTTNLLATLRTVSNIWNMDLQNKNAQEIAQRAGALYDKFQGFTEDLMKLGKDLETTQKTYKASMNKLVEGRGNLVRSSQKLKELGAKPTKDLNQRLLDRADD